jgi:hypothetical protein
MTLVARSMEPTSQSQSGYSPEVQEGEGRWRSRDSPQAPWRDCPLEPKDRPCYVGLALRHPPTWIDVFDVKRLAVITDTFWIFANVVLRGGLVPTRASPSSPGSLMTGPV